MNRGLKCIVYVSHLMKVLLLNVRRDYVTISPCTPAIIILSYAMSWCCPSTIIPTPKYRGKCLNDSSNYRGIALSSLPGKVLDNILLCDNVNIRQTSDMKFGFKSKHSTTQCTFVLNEVIDYYLMHDSLLCLVLLDASQAFDRVQYVKLF